MSPASPSGVHRRDDSLELIAERAGIELVGWPRCEPLRRSLARAGVPRLLIVDAGSAPPDDVGLDEDWVRQPVDLHDARARLRRLAHTVERLQHDRPVLDPGNIVHVGRATVALSAAQASLLQLLLDRAGHVVPRVELESALWPDRAPGTKALDAVVFRLRRRLSGLGVVVRSAPGRGFVIDMSAPPDVRSTDHPTAL